MRWVFLLLLLISCTYCFGQKLANLRASFDGERVVVNYDLTHPDAGQKFKLALYSSHDNYAKPLTSLTGDVGEGIVPGKDHRIIWDVRSALPSSFDGEITFKIKGSPMLYSNLILTPLSNNVYKRGKPLDLTWTGGTAGDKLTIVLYKDDVVIQQVVNKLDNKHNYAWSIPSNTKTGKDYTLKVYNPDKPGESATTQTFSIKPKVSVVIKVLPLLAIGAVFLIPHSSTPEPGPPDSELPALTIKPN